MLEAAHHASPKRRNFLDKYSAMAPVVYLDNAATTMMPPEAVQAMAAWVNRGNPSAGYASARQARALIEDFRAQLARYCGVRLPQSREGAKTATRPSDPAEYELLFTSGASESNCTIVRGIVQAYTRETRRLPHVVSSSVEHHSLLACLQDLAREGAIQLTLVPPDGPGAMCGAVDPDAVGRAVRPNTALVTIMAANNETGVINNLPAIARAVNAACVRHHQEWMALNGPHAYGRDPAPRAVPIHTDAVQLFGKSAFAPRELGVDAFSVSFHKLGGPPGVGLLGIRRQVVDGLGLCPLVCGTQNAGLRGGTEAVHQLAAAAAGFRLTAAERGTKNRHLAALKNELRSELARCGLVCRYLQAADCSGINDISLPGRAQAVWVAPTHDNLALPGTLLLSLVPPRGVPFCNSKARRLLEERGFIVSIGSACNTSDLKPSHVLEAIGVCPAIGRGTLRISCSSNTKPQEIRALAKELAALAMRGTG